MVISGCRRQMDLAFVLDFSGSTKEEQEMAMEFTRQVIQGVDMRFDRTRVGVVSYSDSAKVEFRLDKYGTKLELLNALVFNPARGRTHTADGLRLLRTEIFRSDRGDRSNVPNKAIVITDGYSNINAQETELQADEAKKEGIELIAVGIGDKVEMSEIYDIASDPVADNALFITMSERNRVVQIADRVSRRLCQ